MSFATNLRRAMAEQEVTHGDLAKALGIGKSSVSQYFNGSFVPNKERLKKIAIYLDCSVEWLTGKYDHQEELPPIGVARVKVKDVARRLGVAEQSVRVALQQGTAPYGYAWRNKNRWGYHISPKKLDAYCGGT